ncbi:PAAR domain-containing protein [Pseudomonas sp. dw_358]|uniref:PAAR domain-containing protein n=1 Tax=Pseudomonas sp. dw_358 TaxID=2720083 RepID=UPI001BD428E9|nr:PAAR domain-containing protein [Pseudomonas sp. dw_358]
MAYGYFIGKGDRTSCGGTVLEGDDRVQMFGLLHSREGDRVSCGQDGQTYPIIGGIHFMDSHGKRVAGTLDSISSCPCRARLIPSATLAQYESRHDSPPGARSAAASPVSASGQSSPQPPPPSSPPARSPAATLHARPEPQEPGFYVVPRSTSRQALLDTLFPSPPPGVLRKFMALNPEQPRVKAGTLVVLSDPNNHRCTHEEAVLMQAAAEANAAIASLSEDEADFMMAHRDEIETFMAHSSLAAGIGVAIYADNVANVQKTLKKIEALHTSAFMTDGHLRSPEFFAERRKLMNDLNSQMTRLTRRMTGFPDHPNLKHALGISNKSLVHHWSKAGAPGQIPGYTTHQRGVAKAASILKAGGWLATAIGGGGSVMKVQDVCRAGMSEACRRVKFTETGSFTGAVAGGALAGNALAGIGTPTICAGIGVVTAPAGGVGGFVCAAVLVGVASAVGGLIGSQVGERIGEIIHEVAQ